jgi:nuclear pore complex protein Nup210
VGRPFDYAEVILSHRLNRYDTVIVSPEPGNTTYIVKATKQGDAVLKIWLSSKPRVTDDIRIRVGYAIIPSLATIHLGSPVCFSTHLTEDKPGSWSVGEEGVMALAPTCGVGRTRGVGRTVVYHKIEDTTDTHTEITVAKVERVEFNLTRQLLTPFTNGHRQEGIEDYALPIQFFQAGNETFTPIHTSPNIECLRVTMGIETPPPAGRFYYIQQVPFECQVELRDHNGADVVASKYLGAQATFDPYTGESSCKLLRVDSSTSTEGLSTRNGLKLSLKVIAFDFSHTYSVMSDSLAVPFEPGFHVTRREVIISVIDTTAELTLTGLLHQLQAIKVREGRDATEER